MASAPELSGHGHVPPGSFPVDLFLIDLLRPRPTLLDYVSRGEQIPGAEDLVLRPRPLQVLLRSVYRHQLRQLAQPQNALVCACDRAEGRDPTRLILANHVSGL